MTYHNLVIYVTVKNSSHSQLRSLMMSTSRSCMLKMWGLKSREV